MEFSEHQIQRYSRHILLPQVGGSGQEKLLRSKVLVVGVGGLGSPVILYLAAAGVGQIGIVDGDTVDISNLQRQILHTTDRIGMSKVVSAKEAVGAMNGDVKVSLHDCRITHENALDLISQYDVVADSSDNFTTRYLLNDACFFAKKPLVSGAILRFDGQISVFNNFPGGDDAGACYRCLYPQRPPAGQIPSCAEAGVLGALCGTIGSLQATEILKLLLGIGDSLSGKMLLYDALDAQFTRITVRRNPDCVLCGCRPTLINLGHFAKEESVHCQLKNESGTLNVKN